MNKNLNVDLFKNSRTIYEKWYNTGVIKHNSSGSRETWVKNIGILFTGSVVEGSYLILKSGVISLRDKMR